MLPDLTGKTILQVAPELSAGGVERTVLEVTEALVQAGARALLASRGGRLEDAFRNLGGELFRIDAKARNPVTLRLNQSRLASIIRKEKVDLIHARSRAPAWSALWAARQSGIPFVTTYHGIYSGKTAPKVFYNSVMARGDLVIANSQWTAAHIQSVHGTSADRIVTIPRGVDLGVFDPARVADFRLTNMRERFGLRRAGELCLLLPGRLTDWKGQRVAIAAFALLPDAPRQNARLVLAGDAQGRLDYVDTLKADIATAGLEERVLIAPHIDDMPAALMAADIILQPSTRPEAFGRVTAEASAMARPVIVADHGGARETVIDGVTGLRVAPGDADALAEAMQHLLQLAPEARAAMGAAGRAHVVQHFSTKGLQAATLTVYKRLIDQASKGSRA